MGFLHDKRSPFDFPPGMPAGQQAREECDRFGLPMHWSFLGDDERQFGERMAATDALVRDAAEAVIRQVGRKRARQLFLKALRPPPPGPEPDEEENTALLAAHDRQIALGVPPDRAARFAAEEMKTGEEDVESIASQIRRLVRKRAKAAGRAQAEADWLRKLSPSLLEESASDPEADI